MKITIESTSKAVFLNGMECRIWEGHTESGIPVHCYIPRVAVHKDEDTSQFERELKETRAPSAEVAAIPMERSEGDLLGWLTSGGVLDPRFRNAARAVWRN